MACGNGSELQASIQTINSLMAFNGGGLGASLPPAVADELPGRRKKAERSQKKAILLKEEGEQPAGWQAAWWKKSVSACEQAICLSELGQTPSSQKIPRQEAGRLWLGLASEG